MKVLRWDDKRMSVDIKLIDNHHKELLNIINKLATSIHENSEKKDVVNIIDRIIDYAQYHFSTEESLFDKFDYEEAALHKEEHANFIKTFEEMKDKTNDIKFKKCISVIAIAENVFTYMVNWFFNHVAGCDRKYIKLFKENGIK